MKQTVGFPLEARITLRLFKGVGLSFAVYTNINFVNTYSGALIGIQFGKLNAETKKKLREIIEDRQSTENI